MGTPLVAAMLLTLLMPLVGADDTVLLDGLAAGGGLITLQPRTYHHTGDWVLWRNNTAVRGAGVGLTKLVMHRGTVLARANHSDAYSHRYTYDKPLTDIALSDFEVELVQNHSLDEDGHCCHFEVCGATLSPRPRVASITKLSGPRVAGFTVCSPADQRGPRRAQRTASPRGELPVDLTRELRWRQHRGLPQLLLLRHRHRHQRFLNGLQSRQPVGYD